MRKNKICIITLVLFFFVLSGCKRQSNSNLVESGFNVRSFDYIDVSMYDGWEDFYSLKLYRDGKIYINNNQHNKGEINICSIVSNKELDSISKTVDIILKSSIDTVYKFPCEDCARYNLIIKSNEKELKSFVNGVDYNNKNIKVMNSLISFLRKIAKSSKASNDSVFNFESKTPYFIPLPPPPHTVSKTHTIK